MFKDKNPVGLSYSICHDLVVFRIVFYERADPLSSKRVECNIALRKEKQRKRERGGRGKGEGEE